MPAYRCVELAVEYETLEPIADRSPIEGRLRHTIWNRNGLLTNARRLLFTQPLSNLEFVKMFSFLNILKNIKKFVSIIEFSYRKFPFVSFRLSGFLVSIFPLAGQRFPLSV